MGRNFPDFAVGIRSKIKPINVLVVMTVFFVRCKFFCNANKYDGVFKFIDLDTKHFTSAHNRKYPTCSCRSSIFASLTSRRDEEVDLLIFLHVQSSMPHAVFLGNGFNFAAKKDNTRAGLSSDPQLKTGAPHFRVFHIAQIE